MRDPKILALGAAFLGYLLDAMDVLLYVFAIPQIRAEFGLSNADAGFVSACTLLASAAGGIMAGWAADRWGRSRVLAITILLYSAASAGSATAGGLGSLVCWRILSGLGLGGEWAAGAALVAEMWPAERRGRAIAFMQSGWAIGYMAAAVLSAAILPRWGWRTLFVVGVAPAVLAWLVRRHVPEPAIWSARTGPVEWRQLFRQPLGSLTVRATALATSVLLGYWGLFTWLPAFLAAPANEGGAGLGILTGSTWTFAVQLGALAGYLCFGVLADAIGRRPAFAIYVLAAAGLVVAYGLAPQWAPSVSAGVLLALGPPLGFFGSGYFSLFGALLSELFPTAVRALGVGFTYNFGRAICAAAPFGVGMVADSRGYGTALALNSSFFLLAAGLVYLLPETRSTLLDCKFPKSDRQ